MIIICGLCCLSSAHDICSSSFLCVFVFRYLQWTRLLVAVKVVYKNLDILLGYLIENDVLVSVCCN